jgi:hypothetical protein
MEDLRNLIEPRLFEAVNRPDPSHDLRVKVVLELKQAGLNSKEILNQIKTLDWQDFDINFAEQQIHQIFNS